MAHSTEIEIWADSFHEGQWACAGIARAFEALGGTAKHAFEHGFQPVHDLTWKGRGIRLRVYGSYNSWSPQPERIRALLTWGKPDFLAYLPDEDRILFAVEETAAVPTGNQALQRCERLLGAVRAGVPYWYLLPEYGQHVDGGVRRDSIWPSLMALNLTESRRTPCAVLHFGSKERPEDYRVGVGPGLLREGLAWITLNLLQGKGDLEGLGDVLARQYRDMLRFLDDQWPAQLDFLPGADRLGDEGRAVQLSEAALGQGPPAAFTPWPRVADLPAEVQESQASGDLIKPHAFAHRLEQALDDGKAWRLSSRSGSRPQKRASVKGWLAAQRRLFDRAPVLEPPAAYPHRIGDFPLSPSGALHVTSAPNIVYLFDRWSDVVEAIEASFGRLAGRVPLDDPDHPAFVYVCNSMTPGRLFGDPFTGQLAAYSTVFAGGGHRRVLAWYPNQAHTQAIRAGRAPKGLTVLREVADYALFAGGVLVQPASGVVL